MRNLARKLGGGDVSQETGTVTRTETDGSFVLRCDAGSYHARRARSCLVAPECGDIVLLATLPRGECYVLAVLDRPGEGAGEERSRTKLSLDGDLEIELATGRLTVAAQQGVDLAAGGNVSVVAPGINVHAADGNVLIDRLSVLGSVFHAEVDRIKVLAASAESVFDRVVQRVKRAYRTVEETDQLRAGRMDYVAKTSMNLHAGTALLTAEELVKLDGEQIHLG